MKTHTKATSDGIGYASKSNYEYENKQYEADLQHGDKVTILDGGAMEPGTWGERHMLKIKTRNGEKKAAFNQSTINVVNPAFGEDSDQWVGKEVTVLLKKTVIANEKVIVAYFVTEGWYLDDYGDLVNDVPKTDAQKAELQSEIDKRTPQTPTVDISEDEIKDSGIPF